jgi:peptide-methionine (S)-S-oxide reductase
MLTPPMSNTTRWTLFALALAVVLLVARPFVGAHLSRLPGPGDALPGRATPTPLTHPHHIFGTPLDIAPPGTEVAVFGMGCFWGAEQHFFHHPGVVSTAVGYAGGQTPNPTYHEVCTGNTGHAEVVRVVFDPRRVPYEQLLRVFWEGHDPTEGMRQGNDFGTQYRSAIYTTTDAQRRAAIASRDRYAAALRAAGRSSSITTEIRAAVPFYFAEAGHQQYCELNPTGYCGHGGTGVALP